MTFNMDKMVAIIFVLLAMLALCKQRQSQRAAIQVVPEESERQSNTPQNVRVARRAN